MRKYLLIIALASCMQLSAQSVVDEKTMFNIGSPLSSYWTNISNLASNISMCKGTDVEIQSFRLIGEVKSLKKAVKLVWYNIKHGPHYMIGTRVQTAQDNQGNKDIMLMHVELIPFNEELRKVAEEHELFSPKRAKETVIRYVKEGYKVFLLEYSIDSIKYKEYVFLDPYNYQVVPCHSFWGPSEMLDPTKYTETKYE